VNDAVNVGVSLEDLIKALLVGDIELDKLGLLAADSLNAVQGLSRRVVKVIGNNHLVTRLQQGKGGEGANIAGTTTSGGEGMVSSAIALDGYSITMRNQEGENIHTQQRELNQQT